MRFIHCDGVALPTNMYSWDDRLGAGLVFGLLIHATTKGGYKSLARVTIALMFVTFAVWAVEAQLYPSAEKTANRCSL